MKAAIKNIYYIILFFGMQNNACLCTQGIDITVIKKRIIEYKKAKKNVSKVVTLLKKRERLYKTLMRNVKKLHQVILKKIRK